MSDVRFAISIGSIPVRLSAASVKLTNLFNSPISGGMKPKRSMFDTFKEMARESWSQETPEKEQWAVGDKECFQSSRPEPLGPITEDLSFNSTS